MYVAYYAPHAPIQAKPDAVARWQGRYLQGWDVLRRERFERQRELGLLRPGWRMAEADPIVPPWSEQDKEWQDLRMAVYAAMVEEMDRGIGQFLRRLKRPAPPTTPWFSSCPRTEARRPRTCRWIVPMCDPVP